MIDALEEATGHTIEVGVTPDIPTFEACLAAGAFDIAYMNPYHYVAFSESHGYASLVHRTGPGLRGVLVARSDTPFADLSAVDGQRLSFPSAAAFGASILIRGELRNRGYSFEPVYVESHASVYLTVNARAMLAGGGVRRTFRVAPEIVRPNLRIVYETAEYTPHAIAAHPDLKPSVREDVQAALVALATTHPEVLGPLGIAGWQVPGPDAYEDVRALNIAASDAGMVDLEGRTCLFG